MMYLPTLPELFARPWGKTLDLEFRRMRTDSRSEEHTSELQSQSNLVCRLLLEKKKLRGFLPRSRAPGLAVRPHGRPLRGGAQPHPTGPAVGPLRPAPPPTAPSADHLPQHRLHT